MKTCIRCGLNKSLDSFHKHKRMKDGHLNKCAVCVKECVAEWRLLNPDARKKEHAKNRERTNKKTWDEHVQELKKKAIGRKTSSLKYAYKRRRLEEKMFISELDEFVFEEAAELCKLREKTTGFKWHIDHIVPMMHKQACGLNTAFNLQVVPALWNIRKGNRNMDSYFTAGY